MKDIDNCSSRVLFKTSNSLGTPVLTVSLKEKLDHFYISRKGTDIRWDIKIESPSFIKGDEEMTLEEKIELYNLMNNNWNDVVENLKAICHEDCEDSDCPFYNRAFPKTAPDYKLLKLGK